VAIPGTGWRRRSGPFSDPRPARDHQQRDRKLQRGCQRGNEDGLRAGSGGHPAAGPRGGASTFQDALRGVHVQGALGIAIAVVLGFVLSSPLNAFALLGTMVTLIVSSSTSSPPEQPRLLLARTPRRVEPDLERDGACAGIVIFIPVLLASFGIDFAGLGIVSLTAPANAAPWIDLAWLVLGAALYLYLSARSPAALKETATIFVEA